MIQEITCPDSFVSISNSTVPLRRLFHSIAQQPTSPEVIEPSRCAHKPTSGHQFDQNLLPQVKIFLQKRLPQKGYPLFLGRKPFLDRFSGEGA